MRKLLKRLFLLGAAAGAILALRNYLGRSEATGPESVQVSFSDGSTETLPKTSAEAREFTDIASKVLEASGR